MATRLKQLIVQHDERQYDLARRTQISETRLSRLVCGRAQPTSDERRRLAEALRVAESVITEADEIVSPVDPDSRNQAA